MALILPLANATLRAVVRGEVSTDKFPAVSDYDNGEPAPVTEATVFEAAEWADYADAYVESKNQRRDFSDATNRVNLVRVTIPKVTTVQENDTLVVHYGGELRYYPVQAVADNPEFDAYVCDITAR